jgi:hypothetical protein
MSTALTADAQAQRSAAPSPSIGSSRTVRSEASSSRQLPLRSVTPERFLDGFQLSPEKEAWDHRTTNVEAPVTESGSPRRKHRSGKSGGFLLDSAYTIAHGQNRQSVHHHGKGKSKDEPGSSSGLERARIANHKHKPSIGSSPLANAVTNVNRQALDEAQAVENATEAQNARPVESIQDASRNVVNRHGMLNLPSFDADPAQIVNMALNLSENRRRHFSTGYVAPVDPAGGRRIVSTGRLGPPLQPSPRQGDNTKYRNAFSRTSPRDPSPRLNRFLLGNNSPLSETQNGEYYENAPTMNFPTAAGPLIDPSDATLVRVEKARETMELGLQYRRLLQYLPKLPVPQSGRSGENNNPNNETLGRSYNPLQYIRNRKVRTRERHLFNSEADGWRDIDKVKNWIDEVADMRKDHVSRVDDKFPLPSFGEKSADPTSLQGTVSPPASIRQNNGTNSKPTRPRKDWNFDYWDLLADAHWLDQRDNKYLIEDRDGKKLYQKAKLQKEHERRQSKEIQRHQPRRSESIPRQIISAITPRTSTADGRRPGEERGRPRHQLHDSITSAHEYSSSTDRKSRWARKLKRSESFSSSEESAAGSLRDLSRSRVHPYSRARQESAVLDKQVMQLLAQENEEDIDWEMVKDFQKLEESKTPPQTSTRHPSTAEDPTDPGIKHITKKLPSPIKIPSKDTLKRGGDSLHKPQLSLEDDSTAPNSPELESLVPGIAINLSPPGIQRDSISRRLLPSISRSDSKERHRVSQTDFAVAKRPASNSRLEQIRREAVTDSDSPRSPADSLLSPKDAIDISKSLRRTHSDGKRPHENGHAKESISKLKQLAKVPGKIADRVVHPSRVGDLIRRKESVDSGRLTSPRSGHASEASDADEDAFGNRLDEPISRRATNTSDGGTLSRKTTSNETRYFNNNLPVFRSPFKKRDGDESGPIMRGDHISQQQSALRDRGRQDRFHRLKPPSLDMRSVSPSPDPPMQRSKSNESENTFDETRRGSDPSGRRDSRSPVSPASTPNFPHPNAATLAPTTTGPSLTEVSLP